MMRTRTPQYLTSNTGKTCSPACWRPVASWSAEARGVKDLEAVPSEVLKPKQTLFVQLRHTPVCVCVHTISSVCHCRRHHPPHAPFKRHPFLFSPRGLLPC